MIIHSRFKDYYDTASAYGVDTTVHYEHPPHFRRNNCQWIGLPSVFDDWTGRVDAYLDSDREECSNEVQQAVVGFCGFLYPVFYTTSGFYEAWKKLRKDG